MRLFTLLFVAVLLTGCVGVSMHSIRQVRIHVTRTDTGEPLAHTLVRVSYAHDGYGVSYVVRMPQPVEGETDDSGFVTLPLASFRFGLNLEAGGSDFKVNKTLVRRGGVLADSRQGLSAVRVELVPE